MKITKLLAIALLPSLWSYAQAQEQTSTGETQEEAVASPLKNKVYVAAARVYSTPISTKLATPDENPVKVEAPLSQESSSLLALEVGWYVSNTWRLGVSAGFDFSKVPGYTKKTGVPAAGEGLPPTVPEYATIPERHLLGFAFAAGGERFFHTKSLPSMVWYVGGRLGYSYLSEGYNKDEAFNMGPAHAETFSLRVSPVIGVDYYLIPQKVFAGIEVNPLSYSYSVYTAKSRPSLGARSSDAHSFNILGGPNSNVNISFKIGLNL